jgi:hypothetical protein
VSWAIEQLVRGKVCGSSSRKAVLLSLANRANDDGSDVWVSKTRIAAETELARSTVVSVMQELEYEGVIRAIGKKPGRRGYTVAYHMSVAKISAFPAAWGKCSDPNTMDADLGNDLQEPGIVSDHATLPLLIVSKSTPDSVRLSDKNNPYRTKILNPSDQKKASPAPKRTSSFVRWEAQRERDPIKASALYAEADELAAREFSA